MTARRDPDHLIKAFLEDGVNELPDRTYDAVRSEIEHTSQRVVIGPWRLPNMNSYAKYGLAAAAAVVVAVLGFNLMPRGSQVGGDGPTPGPTTQPTSTAAAPAPTQSPAPSVAPEAVRQPASGPLAAGDYYVTSRLITNVERLSFTVPEGWEAEGSAWVTKAGGSPSEVTLSAWNVTHIFETSCEWEDSEIVAVASAEEVVAALAAQEGHDAPTTTNVTLGGFPAQRLQWTVPSEFDASGCTNGNIRYWPGPGINQPDFDSGFCCDRPGYTMTLYVVDVGSSAAVLATQHYSESSPADRAELEAVVQSIQIVP